MNPTFEEWKSDLDTILRRVAPQQSPPGYFVAWFRSSPFDPWERIGAYASQAVAFRQLVDLTRGRGGPDAQRFVTRGRSPDEVLDALDDGPPSHARPRSATETARRSLACEIAA